jgi:hypothetical protein
MMGRWSFSMNWWAKRYLETRKLEIGPHSPVTCKTHIATATTTTTFRIVFMLEAMGIKRLINHKPIPTTIRAMTIFIKGMF